MKSFQEIYTMIDTCPPDNHDKLLSIMYDMALHIHDLELRLAKAEKAKAGKGAGNEA